MGESARWCSLCFAAREVGAAAPVDRPGPGPAAPLPVVAGRVAAQPAEPEAPAVAVATVPDPAPASWPCGRCGQAVPLAEDVCPACGAGFLAGSQPPLRLAVPGVGDVTRLSQGQVIALATGFGVALLVAGLLLATLLGHLL
jgi:hypothetical protein